MDTEEDILKNVPTTVPTTQCGMETAPIKTEKPCRELCAYLSASQGLLSPLCRTSTSNAAEAELSKSSRTQITLETVSSLCCHLVSASAAWWQKLRDLGGVSSPRPSDSWTQTQPLNITMTSLINHSQSVRYSLFSTSHWQCHLHTSLSVFWHLIFLFIFLRLLLHVNHVQPICTFLSCTVMLILIFKSTVYYHAHFIYFFYSFHFMYTTCVVFYNIALSMERTWLTFHCWLVLSV